MRMPAALLVGILSFAATDALAQCAPPVQRLLTDRKFAAAQAELRAQLARAPNDDAAMDCMGRLRIEQGDAGDAVDWLDKALAINGRSAAHHLGLANALRAQAPAASAFRMPFMAKRMKSEYEQAIALDGSLLDAHQGLFVFLVNAPGVMGGGINKAREEAAAISKLSPMRGHLDYGTLADHDKDYAGAERQFLAAIAAAPDNAIPYNATGAFYRRRERWSDAIAMYDQALKAKPEPPSAANAHYGLGMVHQSNGRRDQARAEFQAALAINPTHDEANKALASLK